MGCIREHIHWLDFFCFVAQVVEDGEVSGQGGWVAGDVDDALGLHLGEGLEDGRGTAGSWRVYYYYVGTDTLLVESWHDDGGIAYEEVGVADVVVAGILLGIEDGRFDDLDADDLTGFLGEEQRDGSSTAVGIDDDLAAAEVGIFEGFVVEHLGLIRVDLKEGTRRDVEVQTADAVEDGGFAPQEFRIPAHDDVVMIGLDVLLDTDDFRQFGPQQFDEFFFARQVLGGGDNDNHDVAVLADATDDMAQDTVMPVFVVDRDVELRDDLAHGVDDVVIAFLLDMAVGGVDDLVASLGKAADDGLALLAANRELHLIAVVPRGGSTDGRLDEEVRLLADAGDGIDDLLAFGFELGHVVEMLELAAAALVIDGTGRLDTVRAPGQDGLDVRTGIGLLDFVDDGQDFLARQGIGNEYGKVFIAADTFGTGAEGLDLDFV